MGEYGKPPLKINPLSVSFTKIRKFFQTIKLYWRIF